MGNVEKDIFGRINVYTDGSCSNNGRDDAKGGIGIWFGENNPHNVSETLIERKITNIVTEIVAVIRACEICLSQGWNRVKVITDSQYLINSVTIYMHKWKENNWVNCRNLPVAHKELFEKLSNLLNCLDVKFEHVPGHRGINGNEQGDKLPKLGAGVCKRRKMNEFKNY